MTIEHKDITDPNIHEVKGAAAATSGKVLIANGDGTATFQTSPFSKSKMGWWDYNSSGQTVSLTSANTNYELINNGTGSYTKKAFALTGITDIWNVSTDRFDFSGLNIGDTLDIRVDVLWTTPSNNCSVQIDLEMSIGSGASFTIPILTPLVLKSASTHSIVMDRSIYIGSSNEKTYPARLLAKSDTAGTSVAVNGWFVRVITYA